MYGFPEQNFDVTNYSSVISSIAFSKCTKFFDNRTFTYYHQISCKTEGDIKQNLLYKIHFLHAGPTYTEIDFL